MRGREGGVELGVPAVDGTGRPPTAVVVMGRGTGVVRLQVREGSFAAIPHPFVWRVWGGDDEAVARGASAGASTPRRCTLNKNEGQACDGRAREDSREKVTSKLLFVVQG